MGLSTLKMGIGPDGTNLAYCGQREENKMAQNRQKKQKKNARRNFGAQKRFKKFLFLSLFLHSRAAKSSAIKNPGTCCRSTKSGSVPFTPALQKILALGFRLAGFLHPRFRRKSSKIKKSAPQPRQKYYPGSTAAWH